MEKIFLIIVGCLILSIGYQPSAAYAQEPLTLQDAIQIGLENSKSLKISELNVDYAQEKSSEVNANRWANLSFKGGYTRLSTIQPFDLTIPQGAFGTIPAGVLGPNPVPFPNSNVSYPLYSNVYNYYNLQLQLQQPLFTGLQLENSAKAAERTAEATAFDSKADKSNLRVQIATAYWNLFQAFEAQQFMQENLDRTNLHYQQAQDMLNQGMLTQSDVLSAKVQVSNAQLMLLDAQNNLRLAAVALNNVLGVPLNTEYKITSVPQTGDTTMQDISALLQAALENRNELQSLKLKEEAADAAVAAAWGGYLPQIALVGDYYYQRPNQRIQPPIDAFKDTWDASVQVSLPIWNWGQTESKVDEARAQREQAEWAQKQAADAVYLDVTQSYLNFKQAKDKIAVAQTAVNDAEESYRISDQKFKVGLVTNTDLMDAEIALLQAKLNYTQALTGLEIARVSLEKAIGQL
ncbi:MAG TPA: TolC family protein [Candidatus Acidoferrales bacterium]|nr:TolC family protein [Candidatus Acidoferrales bacterium]